MPFVIREVVATPNPNAMKFVLDQPISNHPVSYLNVEAAGEHPLAKQLFFQQAIMLKVERENMKRIKVVLLLVKIGPQWQAFAVFNLNRHQIFAGRRPG